MRIGELARRTGVSRRSLRYYEQHGLLHAHRGTNGWREYDEDAVRRVRAIAELLASGLTLDGVKPLERCLDQNDVLECANPERAAAIYQSRLAILDERLAALHQHRDRLAAHLNTLRTPTPLPERRHTRLR
jgi:DNA-binding transcriptional MerR regulator